MAVLHVISLVYVRAEYCEFPRAPELGRNALRIETSEEGEKKYDAMKPRNYDSGRS